MTNQDNGSGGASGAAARLLGRGLAGLFGAAGRARPAAKPLHPRGTVSRATLKRFGLPDPTGVEWLDGPGVDEVLVRLSRSIGLPGPLPDVLGLAIRIPVAGDRHGDLLFSTTGTGPIGRYVLVPARDPAAASYSTLLPYRAPSGSLLLAAVGAPNPSGALRFDLQVAAPRGAWRRFGTLDIEDQAKDEPSADIYVAFDPMTNTVPGLEPYEWVRQLRGGAYRAARHSRGDERVRP